MTSLPSITAPDRQQFRPEAATAPFPWDRVAAHLATAGLHLDLSTAPRQFKGGLANLNYLIQLNGAPAVLRTPPDGELPAGAHDMRREHRILKNLWKAFHLAPRSMYLCEDESVTGRPFIILEYRQGITLSGSEPEHLTANDTSAGPALSTMMIEVLADIHAVDPATVGLDTLGHPEGFIERAIHGWIRRAADAGNDTSSTAIPVLADWLIAHQARPSDTVLLHNDFKLDNIILTSQLKPVAVIDWDQGTRGDPLFDLATLLSYWTEAGDPPAMQRLAQMPTAKYGFCSRQEAAERYSALTGRDLTSLRFHRVLTLFKLGTVFLQLHNRYVSGSTTDPAYADFDSLSAGIFEFAHDVSQNRYF